MCEVPHPVSQGKVAISSELQRRQRRSMTFPCSSRVCLGFLQILQCPRSSLTRCTDEDLDVVFERCRASGPLLLRREWVKSRELMKSSHCVYSVFIACTQVYVNNKASSVLILRQSGCKLTNFFGRSKRKDVTLTNLKTNISPKTNFNFTFSFCTTYIIALSFIGHPAKSVTLLLHWIWNIQIMKIRPHLRPALNFLSASNFN